MKKMAVLLKEGYEEVEALSPVDILRRASIPCDMIGMDSKQVRGSHGILIEMDKVFDGNMDEYDGVILPGGLPGATSLRDDDRVIKVLQDFNAKGKLCCAICAGPIGLGKAGIVKDKVVTCYPGFESQLTGAKYEEALVQVDGNIITGKGPAAALQFGYAILEALGNDSKGLQDGMQYTYLLNHK